MYIVLMNFEKACILFPNLHILDTRVFTISYQEQRVWRKWLLLKEDYIEPIFSLMCESNKILKCTKGLENILPMNPLKKLPENL